MTDTFKVLSILLSYPTADVVSAVPDMKAAIQSEALMPSHLRRRLSALVDEFADRDLIDLQERYVLLFDRSRSLSLHLFEHVHGESRDRGQAMVDLMALYERHGLAIDAKELPDYLPLFLEFLATLPLDDARTLLDEPLHIIAAMSQRHRKRDSAYAIVFETLEAVARGKNAETPKATADLPIDDVPVDDPNDLAALDRIWEEEAVSFGPDAGGTVAPDGSCPASRDLLARMTPKKTKPMVRRPTDG
jgi:nitrate reductase delta subunit